MDDRSADRRERESALGDRVRLLTLRLHAYVRATAAALDMPVTDVQALGVVRGGTPDPREPRADRVSVGDVSTGLSLSAPATSALVDRLAALGHVERRRSAQDRRRVDVVATDSGRQTSVRMFAPLEEAMAAALSAYDDAEVELAVRVLTDLVEAVDQARPPER